MPAFDRDIIESVTAACQVGQAEVSNALSRAFGGHWELAAGESGGFSWEQLPAECQGAGLLLVLNVGSEAALVVLPESSGVLPAWCAHPDETGRDRLGQLVHELGTLLLPETHPATGGGAGYVDDLEAALRRAGIPAEAGRVSLAVRGGSGRGVLSLIWPACQPADVLPGLPGAGVAAGSSESSVFQGLDSSRGGQHPPDASWDAGPPLGGEPTGPAATSPQRTRPKIACEEVEDGIPQLPPYSRSILKIRVPVMVTLAEAKQPIKNVLDMGPGSIIHFNKPCEDTLALEIAGQKVALGEAVKVGDKFGLWLTSMILPEERFWIISNRAQTERAK